MQQVKRTTDYLQFRNLGMLVDKDYVTRVDFDPHGAVVTDGGIDIRVDWDGNAAQLGRFEVKTSLCGWEHCKNLAVTMQANDLIYPVSAFGAGLTLRFQRGPEYSGVIFKAMALPVVWNPGCAPEHPLPPDYVATRYVDYQYHNSANSVVSAIANGLDIAAIVDDEQCWTLSEPAPEDGIQRCALALTGGTDYEVWVCLQSPIDPDHWLPMDPMVGGEDEGGGAPEQ